MVIRGMASSLSGTTPPEAGGRSMPKEPRVGPVLGIEPSRVSGDPTMVTICRRTMDVRDATAVFHCSFIGLDLS